MLFHILYPMADQFAVLNVFRYLTFRTGGAIITALIISFLFGPVIINMLKSRQSLGQPIRTDGPEGHLLTKKGTPTMGGFLILLALTLATLLWADLTNRYVWVVLGVTIAYGTIGFLDDYAKVAKKRNLGLSKRWKFLGQVLIAGIFVIGTNAAGVSTTISVPRTVGVDLGPLVYGLFVLFLLTAMANAVNFTDGVDGLVAGSGSLVFGAYVLIAFWQFRNPDFYEISGALELGIVAAAIAGALAGFLWWNAAPMGSHRPGVTRGPNR